MNFVLKLRIRTDIVLSFTAVSMNFENIYGLGTNKKITPNSNFMNLTSKIKMVMIYWVSQ